MHDGKARVHSSIRKAGIKRPPEVDGRIYFRTAVFVLLIVLSSRLPAGDDPEGILFDIPRQQAELSLIQFAEQAELTLIVPFNQVQGKVANRLAGQYSVEEAIRLLLLGTGLEGSVDEEGQLSIMIDRHPGEEKKIMSKVKLPLLSRAMLILFGAANAQGVSAQAPAAAQEAGAYIEEIVVEARRRSESLQDVPLSITALTEEVLRDRGVDELKDLSLFSPGLDI